MGRAFEFRKARKLKRWSKMSKTFTRIGKDIVIAVKEGGGDPDTNSRLRQVMQNAKNANMPKENVLRAIKKANSKDVANYNEISLEGYASNGIAVFIECATNNNNRTVADVRSYFSKTNGELGKNGSLEFIFDRKGVFTVLKENIKINLEDFEMELIDGGLEEFFEEEDIVTIICDYLDFNNMQHKIESLNICVEKSELQRFPKSTKKISANDAKDVLKLLDLLEDNDDVQNVFHNMEMTEEMLNLINSK